MLDKGSAGLDHRLGIKSPDRDDSNRGIVVPMRVVIDGLKRGPVESLPPHEPLGSTVIDLTMGMPFLDRLLDLRRIKSALRKAFIRVLSPDEALDLHR